MKNSKQVNYQMILDKIDKKERKGKCFTLVSFSLLVSCFVLLISLRFVSPIDGLDNTIVWNTMSDLSDKFGTTAPSLSADLYVRLVPIDLNEELEWFSNVNILGNIDEMAHIAGGEDGESAGSRYYEVSASDGDNRFVLVISDENRGPIDLWCYGGLKLYDHSKTSLIEGKDVYLQRYVNDAEQDAFVADFYVHSMWIYLQADGYSETEFMDSLMSILK